MEISYDNGTVVKRPSAAGEEGRLEGEATLLAEARHAGVVTLLDSGRDERGPWLRLSDAGGVTVETMVAAGGGDETLLPLLASVATTVADLHDIGVVHGAIDASHVLVDSAGHPLLCSFSRGGHVNELDPGLDVAGLAGLLKTALGDELSPELFELAELVKLAQRTDAARGTGTSPGHRRVSARDIADALAAHTHAHRIWPGNSSRVLRPRMTTYVGERRFWDERLTRPPAAVVAALAGAGVLLIVAAFYLVGGLAWRSRRASAVVSHRSAIASHRSAVSAVSAASAAKAAGSVPDSTGVPLSYNAGILAFSGERFAVGDHGDQVAVGRWFCGDPEVALLRPDGSIYVFDHLATPGLDEEGRLVARAPGATWLRSRPDAKPGCDLIVVGDRKGSAAFRPAVA
jgi:hypothetical protein